MSEEPEVLKYPFDREVENRRIKMAVLETAEAKGSRKSQIRIAKNGIAMGLSLDFIAYSTELLLSEVQLLAEGKDIDAEYQQFAKF